MFTTKIGKKEKASPIALARRPLASGIRGTAFVHLSVDSHTEEVTRKLEEKITLCPEVVALYNVTGDYDFLVKSSAKALPYIRIH